MSIKRPKTLAFSNVAEVNMYEVCDSTWICKEAHKPNGGAANLLDTVALTPHIVHQRAY